MTRSEARRLASENGYRIFETANTGQEVRLVGRLAADRRARSRSCDSEPTAGHRQGGRRRAAIASQAPISQAIARVLSAFPTRFVFGSAPWRVSGRHDFSTGQPRRLPPG
jgi:hypothetical protein